MNSLDQKINAYISSVREVATDEFPNGSKEVKQKILRRLCKDSRDFTAFLHSLKQEVDWVMPPSPEWFDHYCDQYFQFSAKRNSHWVERGVYSSLVLSPETNLLELCHGDGYNSYHFYSNRCKTVFALDFDKDAHSHAVEHHSLPNITYTLGDIRKDIPNQQFDAVIWDTAIEHFTEEEISSIMGTLKKVMSEGAILTGHTLKEEDDGSYHLHQHEREFKSKEDLAQFFEPYFKNVFVFETIHPDRHNYYFYASDSALPFDAESTMCLRKTL